MGGSFYCLHRNGFDPANTLLVLLSAIGVVLVLDLVLLPM